jgi:hypothetical protein
MIKKLQILINDFIDTFPLQIIKGSIIITSSQGVNKSYECIWDIKYLNSEDWYVPDSLFTEDIENAIYEYFLINAQLKVANKMEIIFDNRQIVSIKESWDQSIIDIFEENLPKAKRGTIEPWYMQGILPTKPLQQWHKYRQLPIKETVFDIINLDYNKAFTELNKIVFFNDDWQWDGGYYNIMFKDAIWEGSAGLYIFETVEEKETRHATQHELPFVINEEIKVLYNFIQKGYNKINPKVPFDDLFVTVQCDGTYNRNFELNGVEVYPDAPPMPNVLDANYFMQNLFNCLVINAPANFEWAIYTITRKRLENGATESSGKYYYTVNEDKTDLQVLNPGEEVFMMNVTERLMDEFLEKDLKDFETVVFHYDKTGKAQYKVLKRSDFKW